MAVDGAEQSKMTGLWPPERLRPVIMSMPGRGSQDAGSPWPHQGAHAAAVPAETFPPAPGAPAAKKLIIKLKIKKPQESAAGAEKA
jgi:hypothetical protein